MRQPEAGLGMCVQVPYSHRPSTLLPLSTYTYSHVKLETAEDKKKMARDGELQLQSFCSSCSCCSTLPTRLPPALLGTEDTLPRKELRLMSPLSAISLQRAPPGRPPRQCWLGMSRSLRMWAIILRGPRAGPRCSP